jgi:superfamily II DNA or RNA helicase
MADRRIAPLTTAPVANKGSLTQYAGRILRSHENKTTAEVHDYLDERTGVLAAMLANARPATPVSASPTRAGSRPLKAPAWTGKPGAANHHQQLSGLAPARG